MVLASIFFVIKLGLGAKLLSLFLLLLILLLLTSVSDLKCFLPNIELLFDELDIEEGLKPFVNDYKINVIDVAFLPREIVNKFKSDFKII